MQNDKITSEVSPLGTSVGLEGRDCVPFFTSDKSQIKFEFWYLVTLFSVVCSAVILIQLFGSRIGLIHSDKLAFFAVFGGFLGGWVYDAKWFYRVTARGKNNQYGFPWQPHKFYWRILTPFLSGTVAFATFLLGTTDFLPIAIKNKESARAAFAICFLLGYFSDLVLSRLAAWAEKLLPKTSNDKSN
ncbi:hypothetical protein [Rhodoferax sp.]|uniref:hypothetical protein n=1 Tax=Rhodoferax sp. TaxID=50421 RepID=UPI00374CD29E